MRQYMVEILRISSSLMVFFYRRFLTLDVYIYAFGAENDDSSSNLSIPLFKQPRSSPRLFFLLLELEKTLCCVAEDVFLVSIRDHCVLYPSALEACGISVCAEHNTLGAAELYRVLYHVISDASDA